VAGATVLIPDANVLPGCTQLCKLLYHTAGKISLICKITVNDSVPGPPCLSGTTLLIIKNNIRGAGRTVFFKMQVLGSIIIFMIIMNQPFLIQFLCISFNSPFYTFFERAFDPDFIIITGKIFLLEKQDTFN
jgi:hypothetical protein